MILPKSVRSFHVSVEGWLLHIYEKTLFVNLMVYLPNRISAVLSGRESPYLSTPGNNASFFSRKYLPRYNILEYNYGSIPFFVES